MSRETAEHQGTEPIDAPTDHDLVARIKAADESAFNQLYDRYFQRVYNFSYARLRDHALTEEVVQETFIAVFKSIAAYRGESLLVSWIYGIARNTVNNHLRRAKTHDQRVDRARPELIRSFTTLSSGTPEDHLNLRRSADAIQERLASVADWQAEVFVLRHMENLPIGEIAKRVSRSNDSVRSSLYRVKRLLVDAVGANLGNRRFDRGTA